MGAWLIGMGAGLPSYAQVFAQSQHFLAVILKQLVIIQVRSKWLAALCFVVLGVVKLPLESRAEAHLRAEGSLPVRGDFRLREDLGQLAFAASLGGLRSLVASMTYLQAFTAFERSRWDKVESLHNLTTQLQPRYAGYWDDAATRMAYDAASFYLNDPSRPRLYRNQLYRKNFERGIRFAEDGSKELPQSYLLHERLGEFYFRLVAVPEQKLLFPPDYRKAGEHYLASFENGGLPKNRRFAAYAFARVPDAPDLWQRAYDLLKGTISAGYESPTMVTVVKELEEKLHIPTEQRLKLSAQMPNEPR
jgi:hypothetical protein